MLTKTGVPAHVRVATRVGKVYRARVPHIVFPHLRAIEEKPLYRGLYCIRSRRKIPVTRFDKSFRFCYFALPSSIRFPFGRLFSRGTHIQDNDIVCKPIGWTKIDLSLFSFCLTRLDDLSTKRRLLKMIEIKASIPSSINIWQVFSVRFPFLFSIKIPFSSLPQFLWSRSFEPRFMCSSIYGGSSLLTFVFFCIVLRLYNVSKLECYLIF